jgi:hypothetical protein
VDQLLNDRTLQNLRGETPTQLNLFD